VENLKKISKALHRYDEQHGHLPMISTTGTDGHALFSWRVEILPQLGYEGIYNSLKTEEPWDSRHNIKLITEHENADANRSFDEFQCPSDWGRGSSYAAVVGPKTAWRDSGPVQLSGLADSGRHVIMAVEVFGDDGHWAGPEHLTVEDLMKRVDTEDETKRLGYHPFGSHVLFADGSIWRVSPEMPRALWEKLLAGNVASIDELNVGVDKSDYSAAKVIFDPTSGPDYFQFDSPAAAPSLYALPVWLVSVILLFRRAVKSRKPASTPAAA
jgi:prepilin-type processing-associated H-X9-DG protein